MELSEKIQKIRKENNLTQEQFAEKIYVSRTAVSKWETGRGIPSVDSLQMIAKEFNIRLDDLLSTEEIVEIAKQENKRKISKISSFSDALLCISAVLGLILPLYKIEVGGKYYSTYLGNISGWQGIVFGIIPSIILFLGILQLFFNKAERNKLESIAKISASILNLSAILLYILSQQPYPAIFFFSLMIIRTLIFLKNR